MVQLHVHPPALSARPGERPEVTRLARHQAAHGELVTNLRHALVRPEDDRGRRLIALLDGTRDRDALAKELGDADALERSLDGLAQLALIMSARQMSTTFDGLRVTVENRLRRPRGGSGWPGI